MVTPLCEEFAPEDNPLELCPVTLCIAAICHEDGKDRIVLCSDWKSSSSLGSSQTADKLRWIKKPDWLVLTAGKIHEIELLVRAYRKKFKTVEITEDNATEEIESVAKEQLIKRKADYVERQLGVTYEYFRTHGQEFPVDLRAGIFAAIRQIDLGASLLFAGYVKPERGKPRPLLCTVKQDSSVSIETDFGMVGEGLMVAIPPLRRREFDSGISMMKAIYQVYEAKTLAEIVPSVGEDTSLDVFFPDGTLQSLTKSGYQYLDNRLREYGPRPRVRSVRHKQSFFRPFKWSEMS